MRLVKSQVIRTGDVDRATVFQHAERFTQDGTLIAHVFDHLVQSDQIEARVSKGQALSHGTCEHSIVNSPACNLDGANTTAMSDSVGLNSERIETFTTAANHKPAGA